MLTISLGIGEIPYRQYSLRTPLEPIGCNSRTDGRATVSSYICCHSKVRMREDMKKAKSLYRCIFSLILSRGIFLLRKTRNMKKQNLRKYLVLAMFMALAYISLLVMKIGGVGGFLTFDVKDAVITVAAMQFGPLSGIVISLVVSFIEMVTISGTGPWGFLMNFVGSAAFAAIASAIYLYMPRLKKTLAGAVVGLATAAVAMTGVMLLMNILVTPIYMHVSLETVYSLLLPLLLPFNLIKAVANAAIVFVLYKPLCVALRKIHVMDGETAVPYRMTKRSVVFLVMGLLILIACILLLVLTFGGRFEWFSAK